MTILPSPAATGQTATGPTAAGQTAVAEAAAERAALERLAALLDPRWLTTTLVTGQGRTPRLTVAARHARLAEDVHAGGGWYLTGGVNRIAPLADPAAAARDLTRVLCADGEPPPRG